MYPSTNSLWNLLCAARLYGRCIVEYLPTFSPNCAFERREVWGKSGVETIEGVLTVPLLLRRAVPPDEPPSTIFATPDFLKNRCGVDAATQILTKIKNSKIYYNYEKNNKHRLNFKQQH
jgi:hypothetical protein